jgi:putative FmdB family regulatory protein
MPIYEYHCDACGHEFEVMQKITDEPVHKCEACKKLKARRMISQSSFQLKGGGWYSDLYSSSSSKTKSDSGSSTK